MPTGPPRAQEPDGRGGVQAAASSAEVCLFCQDTCELGLFAVEPVWTCSLCRCMVHMRCYVQRHPREFSRQTKARLRVELAGLVDWEPPAEDLTPRPGGQQQGGQQQGGRQQGGIEQGGQQGERQGGGEAGAARSPFAGAQGGGGGGGGADGTGAGGGGAGAQPHAHEPAAEEAAGRVAVAEGDPAGGADATLAISRAGTSGAKRRASKGPAPAGGGANGAADGGPGGHPPRAASAALPPVAGGGRRGKKRHSVGGQADHAPVDNGAVAGRLPLPPVGRTSASGGLPGSPETNGLLQQRPRDSPPEDGDELPPLSDRWRSLDARGSSAGTRISKRGRRGPLAFGPDTTPEGEGEAGAAGGAGPGPGSYAAAAAGVAGQAAAANGRGGPVAARTSAFAAAKHSARCRSSPQLAQAGQGHGGSVEGAAHGSQVPGTAPVSPAPAGWRAAAARGPAAPASAPSAPVPPSVHTPRFHAGGHGSAIPAEQLDVCGLGPGRRWALPATAVVAVVAEPLPPLHLFGASFPSTPFSAAAPTSPPASGSPARPGGGGGGGGGGAGQSPGPGGGGAAGMGSRARRAKAAAGSKVARLIERQQAWWQRREPCLWRDLRIGAHAWVRREARAPCSLLCRPRGQAAEGTPQRPLHPTSRPTQATNSTQPTH
jgi:hypothetical protein